MKKIYENRYIVTDVVSIPVSRIFRKSEAYKSVFKPGYHVIDWYSEKSNYTIPESRNIEDKTQGLYCNEDMSAVVYPRAGCEFVLSPDEEVIRKNAPIQSETVAIVISGAHGFEIYMEDDNRIKIFVTYDENGLIDSYRFDNWTGKPYDNEKEISFSDLQSEQEHDKTNRADIIGTFEYLRKKEKSLNELFGVAA